MVGCVPTNKGLSINLGDLEKYTIDEEKYYEIERIEEIDIKTISAPVEFFATGDSKEIRVHFHGTVETNSKALPVLEVTHDGDEIRVEINRNKIVNIGRLRENLQLDIYLPRRIYEEIAVKTVSGEIIIDEVEANEFSLESVSGSIHVDSAKTNTTTVGTVSGRVNILNFTGDIDAGTVSGSVDVEYAEFNNNIDIGTTSGRINIKLPENAEFGLWAKSTSGRIDCNFPIVISKDEGRKMEGTVGSDKNEINVKTVSGSINIFH
nr:DUF4097 family beta strand repeat-containing protein [Alkaliphilus hydrothermalis]